MMIPLDLLAGVIIASLAITVVAPILLIAFLIRDWRNGKLW